MIKENLPRFVLFAALATLIGLADRAPMHLQSRYPGVQIEQEFIDHFESVVNQTAPGPFVHRILIPYIILGLVKTFPFVNPVTFDFILKLLLLTLLQVAFYRYGRFFVQPMESFAGVFLLMVLLGFSFSYIQGPSIMETADAMNALVFVLALTALYQNKFVILCVVLLVGTLNRESTWVLLVPIALHEYMSGKRVEKILVTLLAIAIPYFAVRLLHGSSTNWFMTAGLSRNIPFIAPAHLWKAILANLHVGVLLGPLLLLSLYRFKEQPRFLQIACSIVPPFILVHYVVAWIIEARVWIPLFLVLIPMSLGTLIRITKPAEINAQH